MEIETWQVLAGATALVVLYAIGVVFLDVPATVVGFVTTVVFIGLGVVLGRFLSRYLP